MELHGLTKCLHLLGYEVPLIKRSELEWEWRFVHEMMKNIDENGIPNNRIAVNKRNQNEIIKCKVAHKLLLDM